MGITHIWEHLVLGKIEYAYYICITTIRSYYHFDILQDIILNDLPAEAAVLLHGHTWKE